MAIYESIIGRAAVRDNPATGERGTLTKYINRTGGVSVKGSAVSCSPTTDREVVLQSSEYDVIGIVADDGVPEGSEVWIWKSGSTCLVLYENSTTVTRGQLVIAAPTDGRLTTVAAPGPGIPTADTHFKENGHAAESKAPGTNVLGLADIHFN